MMREEERTSEGWKGKRNVYATSKILHLRVIVVDKPSAHKFVAKQMS